MSIYKACDIRGRFGEELVAAHAARLGAALAILKGRAEVLVCGDGRVSTPALKSALVDSLVGAGCRVVDLGTASTPLFYFARDRLGLETGVMVTASHNPAHDNGFKITLGPLPLTDEDMRSLEALMESGQIPPAAQGEYSSLDLLPEYVDWLAGRAPRLDGMKVVVDCAGGMAALAARQVWEQTGAQATLLLNEVDGLFSAHAPNPAEAKNLRMLQEAVLSSGADLGAAYDGDGDRVVFVDETGCPVTGDQAIVLFARDALRAGPRVVVYDQKCSRAVPEAIRAAGGRAVRERSGHTYIKRAYLENEAAYAGEMSGHHFLRSTGGDDGLAASLIFAHLLRESGETLSRLAASVPSYPITPDLRVHMTAEEAGRALEALRSSLAGEAEFDETDGLRIEFPDGWGLVRRSVTEPALTARFEGVGDEALRRILARVEEACPPLRGKLLS